MTTATDTDMTDAQDVLTWLLTEHRATLHTLALRLAYGDAGMTAVVANAGRAWDGACDALIAPPASTTEETNPHA